MHEPVKEFLKKLYAWSTTCRQLSQESPFPALVTTYMMLAQVSGAFSDFNCLNFASFTFHLLCWFEGASL